MGAENICYERMHMNLKRLGLAGISQAVDGVLESAAAKDMSFVEIIDSLLEDEVTTRRERTCEMKMRMARFPFKKTIDSFDFAFQPSVDRKQIKELLTLRFMSDGMNTVFLGPPGVGKTHLAVALGMAACQAGHSVYFTSADDLVNSLLRSQAKGTYEARMRFLLRTSLLIIDELGYLPLDRAASNLLFQLISRRYEQAASIILTSNRGFGEWGAMFSDSVIASAVLDRLLHRSVTINIRGDSYRLKDKKRAGLIPNVISQKPTASGDLGKETSAG